MDAYDVIAVGSGHNALVAAALLAKAGNRVLVLERNDRPGGFLRTEEVTLPGFKHDLYATRHPLFLSSRAYNELEADLRARGLSILIQICLREYCCRMVAQASSPATSKPVRPSSID